MDNFFIDTEFVEGSPSNFFGLIKSKPTIDLISIAIVAENGEHYYAISSDFNLKEAWYRWQPAFDSKGKKKKEYWLRENVLKPIFWQFIQIDEPMLCHSEYAYCFNYFNMERLIGIYGIPNVLIASQIKRFVADRTKIPVFYGYYSDYDWVVFCWLFGRMIDLPEGYPMYCIDLMKWLHTRAIEMFNENIVVQGCSTVTELIDFTKKSEGWPKQSEEHNALSDAMWNLKLFKMIVNGI